MANEANWRLAQAAEDGDLDLLKALVRGGADVNAKLDHQNPVLAVAAKNGHLAVVRFLASDCRVDVDATNWNDQTSLMLAAEEGKIQVVEYLAGVCGADVNAKDGFGRTALMWAGSCGHSEVVRYLAIGCRAEVNGLDNNGQTALMIAAEQGYIDIVDDLLEACEADLNTADNNGQTALMLAAEEGKIQVVEYLAVVCGADVNAIDELGRTALMWAGSYGHTEVVRYLAIECRAEVNASDKEGFTTLMLAAKNGHTDVVQCLAGECGADVNAKNQYGMSAIRIATDRGKQDAVLALKPFLTASQVFTPKKSNLSTHQPQNTKTNWAISPSEIAIIKHVATKNIGGEYLAKWLDADVSVKLFILDTAHSSFDDEVRLWKQLRHPNVIKMYGACIAGPNLQFFVCEYTSNGSLIEYVKSASMEQQTPWKFLYEAALGLAYLHEREIVHGDLRCSNILIGSDGLSKLSNFWLSGEQSRVPKRIGSMRWQAPEVIGRFGKVSFASDIYALGMCILEAATKKEPWNDYDSDAISCQSSTLSIDSINDGGDMNVRRCKLLWAPETDKSKYSPECPQSEVRWLVWKLCCHDPAKRMNLQSAIYELERLALAESSDGINSKNTDSFTLDDATIELWRKVQMRVAESKHSQHRQAFGELKLLYERLQSSTHQKHQLVQFYTLLKEFHTAICMTTKEFLTLRLSSTRAPTNSIYAFYRRIKSLWRTLDQSVDDDTIRVARWEKQHRELFVSGVADIYLRIRDAKSSVEKTIFLKTLKKEMKKQYEPADQEKMRKAVEVIESKIDNSSISELIPDWFIPWYELIMSETMSLGVGGFGKVFRAKWLDSDVVVKQLNLTGSEDIPSANSCSWSSTTSIESTESPPVNSEALKKQETKRERILKMFRNEVDIWFGVSHPHVIQLFGACHVGKPFFVCEYATNGTLIDFLRKRPCEVWQKLHEAALGIQYLHARGIVHGDLKGNNIVIGKDMKAKVTDFGLSLVASEGNKPQISGALHWVAPECLGENPQSTTASDIYSLGMCIVESLRIVGNEQCTLPWKELDNITVKVHAKRGSKPPRPVCSNSQWELINQMCSFKPERRIKISRVVDELARFARNKDVSAAKIGGDLVGLKLVPDVVSRARKKLIELHDSSCEFEMYDELWNQLENMFNTSDWTKSSRNCSEEFICLVNEAESATLNLSPKNTRYMPSVEAAMEIYALRRRLVKFQEAYFTIYTDQCWCQRTVSLLMIIMCTVIIHSYFFLCGD